MVQDLHLRPNPGYVICRRNNVYSSRKTEVLGIDRPSDVADALAARFGRNLMYKASHIYEKNCHVRQPGT